MASCWVIWRYVQNDSTVERISNEKTLIFSFFRVFEFSLISPIFEHDYRCMRLSHCEFRMRKFSAIRSTIIHEPTVQE